MSCTRLHSDNHRCTLKRAGEIEMTKKEITKALVSDKLMWDLRMSVFHLAIVSVADELGMIKNIGKKKLSASRLASSLNLSSRPVEVLLKCLIGLGLIIETQSKYFLNETSTTYLLPNSPYYWGEILLSFRRSIEHQTIITAIKDGSDQLLHDGITFTEMWTEGNMSAEAARSFTNKMHANVLAPATEAIRKGLFKNRKHLLDLGGGSGCFGSLFTKKYAKTKATLFELPAVCKVAKEYIDKSKTTSKVKLHPGNFFNKSEWPRGHDSVLLSQILHDWQPQQCKQLLTTAYDSLGKGGKIFIHEMLIDKNKSSPLTIACFDLLMFINHKSQQFTKEEILVLLKESGFRNIRYQKVLGYFSMITAIK